jgi:hypothetical protein
LVGNFLKASDGIGVFGYFSEENAFGSRQPFGEENGAGVRPQSGNGPNFEHLKFGKDLPDDEEGLGQFDLVYDRIRAVFVLFCQQFLEGRVCVGRMLLMVPSKVSKSSFFSWSMLERSPFPRPNFLKVATNYGYPLSCCFSRSERGNLMFMLNI